MSQKKGFIFTIDAMMSLLFAFLIISVPAGVIGTAYSPSLVWHNVAVMHQQTHIAPTELLGRIGMCGGYTLFDEGMGIIANEKTCDCGNTAGGKYTYIYVDENGKPFLAELAACRVA